jgi:hypothetical protein
LAINPPVARTEGHQLLDRAAIAFAVALVVHGADHARRGFDAVSGYVLWAGNLQIAFAVVTLGLVLTRHRLAPAFAIAVGSLSAIGFVAAHIFPDWGVFSDAFTGSEVGPNVTWFSWFAALFEIGADVLLGVAGLHARRAAVGER